MPGNPCPPATITLSNGSNTINLPVTGDVKVRAGNQPVVTVGLLNAAGMSLQTDVQGVDKATKTHGSDGTLLVYANVPVTAPGGYVGVLPTTTAPLVNLN